MCEAAAVKVEMGRIDVEEIEEVHERSGSVSRTVQCSKGNSSDDDDGLYNKVQVQFIGGGGTMVQVEVQQQNTVQR